MPLTRVTSPSSRRASRPASRRARSAAAAAILAACAVAVAACAPQTTISASPDAAAHAVSVSATGQAEIAPDAAKASITIEVVDPTSATAAQEQAAAAATSTIAALSAAQVPDTDIATQGLSVGPVYNYTQDGGQQLTGYRASQTLTVTLRDLSTAGATLDAAVQAGGNAVRVDSFAPFVVDPTAAEEAARAQAVERARAQAEQYAELLGFDLGDVVAVSESTLSSGPPPVAMSEAMAAADAKPATPIEAGLTTVSVTVSISWAIG